jgi:hypothetical protein
MASPGFVLADQSPYTPNLDPFTDPGGVGGFVLSTQNSPDDSYGNIITDPASLIYAPNFVGPLPPGASYGIPLNTLLPGSEGLQSDSSGNVRAVSTVRTASGAVTSIFSGVLNSLLAPKGQSNVKVSATGLKAAAPVAAAPSIGSSLTIVLLGIAGLAIVLIVFRPKR